MWSRDISAMQSASSRLAKRIEAAEASLSISSFCDKRRGRFRTLRPWRGGLYARTVRHMPRLIAHLDMDAFYASVELLRYPELRGRAVVIGGGRDRQPRRQADGSLAFFSLRDYAGRGVVTTSTYEARKLGVFSAMGMMKSAVLAPDAVLLPVDFDE